MIWRLGALAVAGVVALPLLGVASSLLSSQGELWRHIAETQLSDIVGNTLVLLVGDANCGEHSNDQQEGSEGHP